MYLASVCAQLGPTLCDPTRLLCPWDSQARTLEWIAFSSSRGSSPLRDRIQVSCIGRQILYHFATWEDLDS